MIKIKKLIEEAVIPTKATDGSAGYDVTAPSDPIIGVDGYLQYNTGLAFEVPPGYHLEVTSRSSIRKYDLILANPIPVIDNDYRGELVICFKPIARCYDISHMGSFNRLSGCGNIYRKGDRIAQILIRKTEYMGFQEVEELSHTIRGCGGFGSTGK